MILEGGTTLGRTYLASLKGLKPVVRYTFEQGMGKQLTIEEIFPPSLQKLTEVKTIWAN